MLKVLTKTSTPLAISVSKLPMKKDSAGKIYFFTNGESIKIGFTKNSVQKRLKQLNTGSDKQLYYLGYINGTMEDEETLHKRFSRLRLRDNGEWFEADQELLDYINSVNLEPNIYVDKNEYYDNRVMALMSLSRL